MAHDSIDTITVLARDTFATGFVYREVLFPGERGTRDLDTGWLAAGSLVRKVRRITTGEYVWQASTDSGETWHWQRSDAAPEVQS